MRVSPDHLVGNPVRDIGDIERPVFSSHLAVEDNLEKQVAKLFLQIGHVATLNRIGHFIGLFDRVGGDRRISLFEIPWAP